MVIGGTVVTGGRGKIVVTGTGMDSEMGKIAGLLLRQQQGQTPLQRKMGEVSQVLSLVCVGVCAVMFGVGMLQHRDILDMFLTAVALAVAAIPEGLPAIVTIVLAIGVGRMAKRNAIIKRLPAVETLGCASVICSDKTGTLTQNQMAVLDVWTAAPGKRPLALTLGTLCSDAKPTPNGTDFTGDPTETAIALRAAREGFAKTRLDQDFPRRGEAPFDAVRKRMATCHTCPGGGVLIAVKGAPEAVLAQCTPSLALRAGNPWTPADRRQILAANEDMARRALRVIGVARRELSLQPRKLESGTVERDLTFLGLFGMVDPPRREVKGAVERCHQAGIRPVMITGDHRATAMAMARELDICRPGDLALTGAGAGLLAAGDAGGGDRKTRCLCPGVAGAQAAHRPGLAASRAGGGHDRRRRQRRPRPEGGGHRLRHGQTGTDVAKGAADMILTDDNFSTIVAAVEQGRGIYANIRKSHPLPALLQHRGDPHHLRGHRPALLASAPDRRCSCCG